MVEFDGFSNINDIVGYVIGDFILFEIVCCFECYEVYRFKLVRLYGDEFVLVVIKMESYEEIWDVFKWIVD